MFYNAREYVNTTVPKKEPFKNKLLSVNVLFASVLLVMGFMHLQTKIESAETIIHKQAVLGVSETISETEATATLPNSMKVTAPEAAIQSEAYYADGMARTLDDKKAYKGRIVVVNDNVEYSSY